LAYRFNSSNTLLESEDGVLGSLVAAEIRRLIGQCEPEWGTLLSVVACRGLLR
jgi:hypothetical protein